MNAPANIPAVLLLGGLGTRIAPLFPGIPKALVPVNGRPFLEIQLLWLRRSGFTRILLAAGHLADHLQAWLDAPRPPDLAGLDIALSREPAPLGTAGALLHALPALPPETPAICVFNGDSLTPRFRFPPPSHPSHSSHESHPSHKSHLPSPTLFVAPVPDISRYGSVRFDPATGQVLAFAEKSPRHVPGHVNAGIYLLPLSHLREAPARTPLSLENDLFPDWTSRGLLRAVPIPEPLLDMGTPEGYALTSEFLEKEPIS